MEELNETVTASTDATKPQPETKRRIYVVDDRTAKVTLVSKDERVLTTHTFRRNEPGKELTQLIALTDSIKRETELGPQGEQLKYRDTPAYAEHYRELIVEVHVKIVGTDAEPVALTADQIHNLTEEHRAKAVGKLYQSKCEVLQNAGTSGFAFLFEPKGDEESSFTTVRQFIGDPENPSFVLDHYVRRPGKEKRESYSDRTRRTFTLRKGDMPRRKVLIDLRPGIELIDSAFVSVTAPLYNGVQYGVQVGGHDYAVDSKDDRAGFLNNLIPIWKADLADALVESFETDIRD
jgi:hypothetical protein